MNVLGVACWGQHEAAAALVVDGQVVAAAEEERFSRKKFDASLPTRAIAYCLEEGRIAPGRIDQVGLYWRPWLHLGEKLCHVVRHLPRSAGALTGAGVRHASLLKFGASFREAFPAHRNARIHYLPHHRCHAASTYLLSGFSEAAILCMDGAGEWAATSCAIGRAGEIKTLWEVPWPDSLGHFYAAVTQHLGFRRFEDEYRVMGLAAFGDPSRDRAEMARALRLLPGGRYALDLRYFDFHLGDRRMVSDHFVTRFGAPRPEGAALEARHADLAAAAQERLEQAVVHVARALVERTGLRRVAVAGGVALNGVAIGKLVTEKVVDEVFVPPGASDAGTALGAALLLSPGTRERRSSRSPATAFLGPSYDDDQIARAVGGRAARRVADPASVAAERIAAGEVIGFFQGRLEFGARALGHRSILADPRIAAMKDIINAKVKHREAFRPFAPAILDEHRAAWFSADAPSPFMNIVLPFRPERRADVPAVVHEDGTGRVQTVRADSDPLFHRLLTLFYALTSVPMVLNTSFNVQGEPIVNTPEEALACFDRAGLDALVIGHWLVPRA